MKYLGIDYGLKKIGLAISEGELATPLKVLHVKSKADALSQIKEVVSKENIDQIIIGAPDSGIRSKILNLSKELNLNIPVTVVDETLSSVTAKNRMIESGMSKKKRMEEDAYSAVEILQNYLDSIKV
ncbi:MAG: Holliday junction resolvase RuvX [Candidatus Daviesbacteria bacterium]|nr:Holliday junction resolvase RuvX [Candidatus Daviesbacteria bacterium]